MNKKKKGFTLIEIAVALAAFMLIMLTITSILISVIKYNNMNNKNYNLSKISQVPYEVGKEKRVQLDKDENSNKYTGGFRFFVDSEAELKTELSTKLFVTNGVVADPLTYAEGGKRYTVGITVEWDDRGTVPYTSPVTGKYYIGAYRVVVYCYDTTIGEGSLLKRVSSFAI